MEEAQIWIVKDLLVDYVRSPSLRHIRDPHSIMKLAKEIVRRVERNQTMWQKWSPERELLLRRAIPCWIPADHLRDFLNGMSGPQLTLTDVTQRLRALEDEETEYAHEELKEGCLVIYEQERAAGTELPAICGLLRQYIESEEDRRHKEWEEQWHKQRDENRLKRELRLQSGADCTWTQMRRSQHWYCRKNGRTYRLSPGRDHRWDLYRVNAAYDDEKGTLLGTYQQRGDATKAVSGMAYQPEPRW